ncbi:MAG TPA: DUF4430 domain-containing protein [Cerasibacillus sp.]|uniref:DUF4430 domain-containing protein n=1 Tax=Cerasibacillus sp. TaxID=2498711 RepID=UPI002F42F07A
MRKRLAIIFTFFLLFSQLNLLQHHVTQAESFDKAVMISAVDEHGEIVVPVTVVPVSDDETALGAWLAGAEKLGIDVDYTDTEYGAFIQAIAGKDGADQFFWSFVVNGKSADTGISSYEVNHGDHLMLALRDLDDFDPSVAVDVSVSNVVGESIIPETEVTVSAYATVYDVLSQLATKADKPLTLSMDDGHFVYVIDSKEVLRVTINDELIEEKVAAYQVADGDQLSIELEVPQKQEDIHSKPVVDEPQNEKKDTKEKADDSKVVDVSDNVLEQRERLKKIPPFSNSLIQKQIKQTMGYIVQQGNLEYGDEWWVWGWVHTNEPISGTYRESIKQVLKDENVVENIFALEKIIITLTALGEDANDFNGFHLIDKLVQHPEFKKASPSINSVIYGLLALDSGAYEADEHVRKHLVDTLLHTQLSDGGWAWFGDVSTVDITAMVLQALAPYQHEKNIKQAIDHALRFLKEELQEVGGYYDEWSGHPSETTSQVIIALTALDIDPTSDAFTTPGGHLLEHLFKYVAQDGGFKHVIHEESNVMATQQAFLALLAYQKYLSGEGAVFDFTAMKKSNQNKQGEEQEKQRHSEKHVNQSPDNTADEQEKVGKKLPNTSTNMYNYLAIGSVIILLGCIGFYRRKKEIV